MTTTTGQRPISARRQHAAGRARARRLRPGDHARRRLGGWPPSQTGGIEWVEPKVARRYREQPPLDLGESAW